MRDDKLVLSDAQEVTATAASTNVIDMKDADHNVGEGKQVILEIRVPVAATADGAATVTFALQDSADNSSWADTEIKTAAIGKATLVKGYKVLRTALPTGLSRYLRVYYTVATGPLTAGAFDAWLDIT